MSIAIFLPNRKSAALSARKSVVAVVIMLIASGFGARRAGAGEEVYEMFRPGAVIHSVADLERCRIAVLEGSIFPDVIDARLEKFEIVPFTNIDEQVRALLYGEVQAVVTDQPIARMAVSQHDELEILPEKLADDQYALAFRYYYEETRNLANSTIAALREDGTLAEMEQRWLDGAAADRVMPDIHFRPDGALLRMGVAPVVEPMCYLDENGEPTGFDIELGRRIAAAGGMRFAVEAMEFAELIPALRGGTVDMIGSCISATPERRELVEFSDTYYSGGAVALIRKNER
ncbi:MAG: transporter substrate-binding domain-containing protein [Planctomycetes bacterium]|nr:transporter substrate-binding domain-containing protein [Planctomycetota bacterium]